MQMERPPEEDCMNGLFRAQYTTKYLEEYIDYRSYNGKTVRDRIQFNLDVHSIKKVDGRWEVRCASTTNMSHVTIVSTRLMMANGQSSFPNQPSLPGSFRGKIVHSIDFGQSDVIKDESIHHIAVIGAGKSAADMVYEAVKAGKTVSWIIRKTGDKGSLGAAAFPPLGLPSRYKSGVELSQTRIVASLQPCYMTKPSWWTWFLHSTSVGAKLITKLFSLFDERTRKYAGYRERESDKGFEKLEYENP
jgi:dimethylaniline monooxygenase (N-oxide forming)